MSVETVRVWERPACAFDEGLGSTASIGLVGLARDRVGIADTEAFYKGLEGVGVFSSRMPSPEVITRETLAAMSADLAAAAALLAPGSRLDVLGFCCTSGTVAIGPDRVSEAMRAGRGDLPVVTPITAAIKALNAFRASRIALLAPYLEDAATMVADFIEAHGIRIVRRATFALAGDEDMNRVSEDAMFNALERLGTEDVDAIFISCTALRTSRLIERFEKHFSLPVMTSNQVMAWDCLRTAGVKQEIPRGGMLYKV